MKGWIGVDLDGTLANSATGNRAFGLDYIGPPIPKMVERVKRWLDERIEVRIVTARVSGFPEGSVGFFEAAQPIYEWCQTHIGQALPVTASKDFAMVALYDDRAIGVIENTGELAMEEPWRQQRS